ncbi:NAD(P)/FAD-dependent oxidoreductase [Streptomyces sp. NPDC015131]|uniref:NAD(P)/FAD-dependent oxidoreductase n=1 Tax=Streptomyces sp. NPDC015131 TaxID=3364941 RepID=UPI0036F62455
MTRTLVVAGHGMVGHRLVGEVRARDRAGAWRVVVLGEEDRPAYDRVALSSYLAGGGDRTGLGLTGSWAPDDPLVEVRTGTAVTAVDPAARTVTTGDGTELPYDALVLATGARPAVPPVPGHRAGGCCVYRTLDDLERVRARAEPGRPGVVVGGGLLGLEAANALRLLGMRPRVVELADRLMPLQVDGGGGRLLGRLVGALGIGTHCGTALARVDTGPDGAVTAVTLADGTRIGTRLVVFAAGVRPRDELAAAAGLRTAPRGGVAVDGLCRTAADRVWAIGDCAAVRGRAHGLVAPGYAMARIVADQLLGLPTAPFADTGAATRLKLLGVEVASFGDVHARTPGALEYVHEDPAAGTYAKLTLAPDGRTLLGGVLVGDARPYPVLRPLVGRRLTAPADALLRG